MFVTPPTLSNISSVFSITGSFAVLAGILGVVGFTVVLGTVGLLGADGVAPPPPEGTSGLSVISVLGGFWIECVGEFVFVVFSVVFLSEEFDTELLLFIVPSASDTVSVSPSIPKITSAFFFDSVSIYAGLL